MNVILYTITRDLKMCETIPKIFKFTLPKLSHGTFPCYIISTLQPSQ